MKNICLLIIVCISLSIVSKAQNEKQLFYYLKVSSANVEVNCYVNGFPVYDTKSEGQAVNQVPINLALIGEKNELVIVAKPMGDNAFINGGISPYGGGEIVSGDDEREGVLQFDFQVNEAITKTFSFDNERFNYADILANSPVITDQEVLVDYGVKLLALIDRKKGKDLIKEMTPKIEDTAEAFSVDASIMFENMKEVLNNSIFSTQWEKVQRKDVVTNSYCDGRVWELTTTAGNPLIYAQQDDGSVQMHIYVAEVGGKLRVVR